LRTDAKRMEEQMSSNIRIARTTGVLFIIATVASLISNPFLTHIGASSLLISVSTNKNQVLVGAFLALIAAVASASIAIALFPILRKHNEGMALAAVGFRLIEGVLYIVAVMCLLVLVTLSQEFAQSVAQDSTYFQTFGVLLLAGYRWVYNVGALLTFSLGALMYYSIFYQTRLVPRWLSGWGIIGAVLCAVAGILVMFRAIGPLSIYQLILALPIAVQEMVLAVWLIVKGLNPSVLDTGKLEKAN